MLHNWTEILCCYNCNQVFSLDRLPINLTSGVVCLSCINNPSKIRNNKIQIPEDVRSYPVNSAFMHILDIQTRNIENMTLTRRLKLGSFAEDVKNIEDSLINLSSYFTCAKAQQGVVLLSDSLSRPVQRRLVSILSTQLLGDGRTEILRLVKSITDRIVTEFILAFQNTGNLSSNLWSAVRSRGCQFLGPAMQEDVLKLILLTLMQGELIARKTLVLYIVQRLSDDYPHVSKTSVGHVVQLLYRASCFNVIKRDGESSLMQLKAEFRNYETLRREHDAQIIQIALESGLRISSDQWSSLLYGDNTHRSYIDNIADSLQLSPTLLSQTISDLNALLSQNGDPYNIIEILPAIQLVFQMENSDFSSIRRLLSSLEQILLYYSKFFKSRNTDSRSIRRAEIKQQTPINGRRLFKTRLCRDILNGQSCPRGISCTFAHNVEELRTSNGQSILTPSLENVHVVKPPPIVPIVPVLTQQPPANPICMLSPNGDATTSVLMQPPCQVNGNAFFIIPPPPINMKQQTVNVPQNSSLVFAATPTHVFLNEEMNMRRMVHNSLVSNGASNESNGTYRNSTPNWDIPDDQLLLLRRQEIVSRLSQMRFSDQPHTDDEDMESTSHVSYTVASSVLCDLDGGFSSTNIELPPMPAIHSLPITFSDTILPPHCVTSMVALPSDIRQSHPINTPPSNLPTPFTTSTEIWSSVRTACQTTLFHTESTKPATVIADNSTMNMTDMFEGPLVISSIQSQNLSPQASYDMVNPFNLIDHVPQVIKPLSLETDPQNIVSSTLDQILHVKERIYDVEMKGGLGSAVEKAQLNVELNIVNQQISTLDKQTRQNCLRKELEALDRKIEDLNVSA